MHSKKLHANACAHKFMDNRAPFYLPTLDIPQEMLKERKKKKKKTELERVL